MPFGEDEDGDPITTAVCREADCDASREAKLTRGKRGVMVHFHKLADEGGVGEAKLRQACINGREVSASDVAKNRGKTATNALKGLIEKGVLVFDGANYRIPSTGTDLLGSGCIDFRTAA